jgi:hypothetical protein
MENVSRQKSKKPASFWNEEVLSGGTRIHFILRWDSEEIREQAAHATASWTRVG